MVNFGYQSLYETLPLPPLELPSSLSLKNTGSHNGGFHQVTGDPWLSHSHLSMRHRKDRNSGYMSESGKLVGLQEGHQEQAGCSLTLFSMERNLKCQYIEVFPSKDT